MEIKLKVCDYFVKEFIAVYSGRSEIYFTSGWGGLALGLALPADIESGEFHA